MYGVVVPTYNEADNIKVLIKEIRERVKDVVVIVVDDNSGDNTAEIAKQMGAVVFVRTNERGLGSALRFGLRKAVEMGLSHIATMDADLSHDPSFLPSMFNASLNTDLVIGSRYIQGGKIENWPLKRKIISKGANLITRILLRSPVQDNTSGYRVYSAKAVEVVSSCQNAGGYEFQICAIYKVLRNNLRIVEVPIIFRDREKGNSKLDNGKMLRWLSYVMKLSLGLTS
ncbi:polyprenol monophosphomannose synthase [Stygiolobus sp. CP850M]|uniref:polyprenol monophosphomannose synthase n=1 Tax=Stygiolobus sp. CP850M TaxID=3133134 RepID=UPI00307F5A42